MTWNSVKTPLWDMSLSKYATYQGQTREAKMGMTDE